MKKGEQFDLFKKPAKESTKELPAKEEESYKPTNRDIADAISIFEEDGRPIELLNSQEQAKKNKEEFERAKQELKKIFEESGTQEDLPM